MRVKMSKQPPPAPTASAVGPCPTVIQIVGRPGTGSLPSTIAPPDHPQFEVEEAMIKSVKSSSPVLSTRRGAQRREHLYGVDLLNIKC